MFSAQSSILTDYHSLSNRLKRKRILKVPNIAEAGEHFETLATRSEGSGDFHTAALCYRSAAKCASSVGHHKHCAGLLVRAARHFMKCETGLIVDGLVSTGENLQAAMHCYHEARERWAETDSVMAASLSLELGTKLAALDRPSAAVVELQKAALWFKRSPLERLDCLQQILALQIKSGEFEEALKTCSDAIEEATVVRTSGRRDAMLAELQVDRILLLLIVEPVSSQVSKKDLEVLERLTWVESVCDSEASQTSVTEQAASLSLNADLFLLLQSTVMAAQASDVTSLCQLEAHMESHMTSQQRSLMRCLAGNINTTLK